MAYYEILMLFTVICSLVIGFIVGYSTAYKIVWKEGFNDAKELFYEDPKKDKEREEQAKIDAVRRANEEAKDQITPELLMAFGVDSTAYLPKDVLEYYRVKESKTLDELINEEDVNDRN